MSLDKFEKINLDLLLEYAANLPASPRIFTRLSELVSKDDTSLDVISSLVKMDPGLTALILRVTNSAFYGGSIKITDVETAISRIGFLEVQKVLSTVVEHDSFFQAVPAYGVSATEFSDECVEVAIASETLAKRVALDPSAPYVAGLLHRIGKLAINIYLEKMDNLVDLSKLAVVEPIETVEREALGFNHLKIGSELLKHWQFEPATWHPIKNQASPIHSSSFQRQTAVLTLSIWTVKALKFGFDPDAKLGEEITWSLSQIGIDPLDIAMLVDDARFEINNRKDMLSMLL